MSTGKMADISVRDMRLYLESCEAEMLARLESWVKANSYSLNKSGADAMGRLLRESFESEGLNVEVIPQSDVGDHLVVRTSACQTKGIRLLCCGHFDTVFPPDAPVKAFTVTDDRISGPGTADMKAGLMTVLYAFKALREFGVLELLPIVMVCNSDEEIGSKTSSGLIAGLARTACAAFVFEGGGRDNGVVSGRKGRLTFRMTAHGCSGHAGNAAQGKISAIETLAHGIVACERLNEPSGRRTVNVGRIEGGVQENVIPDYAMAKVDCRFATAADEVLLMADLDNVMAHPAVVGARLQWAVTGRRPPMPKTAAIEQLLARVQRVAVAAGLPPVHDEFRGGVSDANTIAGQNVQVIDGMGPIGFNYHSADEYILRRSLLERTLLAALLLHDIGRSVERMMKSER